MPVHESARNRVTAELRAPRVAFVTFEGHLDEEVHFFVRAFAESLGEEPMHIFFDTTAMTGFDPAFRQRMLVWQAATKGRVFQVALVKSPFVAVAISIANKFVGGGVELTSNRARFERELATAIARAAARPASQPSIHTDGVRVRRL